MAKILTTLLIVVLVVALLAVLDASIDLSSETAELEAQKIYERNLNRLKWYAENADKRRAYYEALEVAREEIEVYMKDPALADKWVGLMSSLAPAEAMLEEEDFQIEAWLDAQDRNSVCACDWFSAITYPTEEALCRIDETMTYKAIGLENCPQCGRILWEIIHH